MIIHLMNDPGPPPYEPLLIIDRSPFHSTLPRDRSTSSKVERWIPRAARSTLASCLAWLAAAGSPEKAGATADTSPAWSATTPSSLTGSTER